MSEPSRYGDDPIGTCLGCGKDLDAAHYCYGCRTHVCGECNVAPIGDVFDRKHGFRCIRSRASASEVPPVEKLAFRSHDPYDHLREDWCEDE